MVKEASRSSEKRENIIAGAVGAFLGSLLGVVCVVLVGQLGYVVSLSGLVMAVCAIKGYELLGGRLSKKGCIIACLIILGMTYFAHQLSCAITISQEIGLDIFQSFRTISFFLEMDVLDAKAYWGNLFMLYGFTLLGAIPTVIVSFRSSGANPVLPSGDQAQDFREGAVELYIPQSKWLRPLQLAALPAMLLPIVVMLFIALMPMQQTFSMAWVGAALGSFAAMILLLILSFQALTPFRFAVRKVLARDGGGTLWQVDIQALNAMEPYRFVRTMRAIVWDRLTPESQEVARASIQRAIRDISSGTILPGSLLSRAVVPLTDLHITGEDRLQYHGSYRAGNGQKKIHIPKACPGLRLTSEPPAPQGPVPFGWSLLLMSVAFTAVLTLIGWAVAGGL